MPRTTLHRLATLGLALALLAPATPLAQSTKVGGVTPVDALTPQEREMLGLATDFAQRVSQAMERWIATGEITPERLSSALYYPVPATDPPKFTTDYDRLSDRDLLPIQESVLTRSTAIVFAVTVDRNGYLPTHNQRYAQPLTGNLAIDLVNNRTKRIFNDRTGSRCGSNTRPFLLQTYKRDTGEVMHDLSAPIYVDGQHWGGFRVGYRSSAA
jgi:methyl-accepting chemotaxis protein